MVCSDYILTSRVTSMLNELGWESLEERRRELRLALMYKVVFGFVAVSAEDIDTEVLIKSDSRTRAAHEFKFKQLNCQSTAYLQSFFPRTIQDWNGLSEDHIGSPSVEAFKRGGRVNTRHS